jgi:hypothetical protein
MVFLRVVHFQDGCQLHSSVLLDTSKKCPSTGLEDADRDSSLAQPYDIKARKMGICRTAILEPYPESQ